MSLLLRCLLEAAALIASCGLLAWMLSQDEPHEPPQIRRRGDAS